MSTEIIEIVEHSFMAWYDVQPADSHLMPFIVVGTVCTNYRVLSVELKPGMQPKDLGTTLFLQIVAKLTPEPPPNQPHPNYVINRQVKYEEQDREPHWEKVNIELKGNHIVIPVIPPKPVPKPPM